MRMYDLITKKKHNEPLTDAEIEYMIDGYVKGDIPDYQMSSMLMAIWFNGMNDHEITELTKIMAKSGDMIDLSAIALVIELKWNQSAETAIRQIREKRYPLALKGYSGKVYLVGIGYDKKSKKHQCKIELLSS